MGNVGSIEKVMVFGILGIIVGILGIAVWSGNDTTDPPTTSALENNSKKNDALKPGPRSAEVPRKPATESLPKVEAPMNVPTNGSSNPTSANPPSISALGNTPNNPLTNPLTNPTADTQKPVLGGSTPATDPKTLTKAPDVTVSSLDSHGKNDPRDLTKLNAPRTYKVQAGDTLTKIATTELGGREHVQDILDANKGLDPRRLKVGQEIVLPTLGAKSPVVNPVKKTTDKKNIEEPTAGVKKSTTEPAPIGKPATRVPETNALKGNNAGDVAKGANDAKTAQKPAAGGARTYTVKKGDTLYSISKQFYGSGAKVQEILAANKAKLKSANDLSPGMVLNIP